MSFMSLDVADTVKATFRGLLNETGLKVAALLFVTQAANLFGSTLYNYGTLASLAGGLLQLGSALAGIIVLIGGLRSLDAGRIRKRYFTENLLWPALRSFGANITTTVFMVIALLPGFLALTLTGAMGAVGISSSISLLLGAVFGLLTLVTVVYAFYALVISLPEIVINDARMFESLDKSIQRTNGRKISMFLSGLPVLLIYLVSTLIIVIGTIGASSAGIQGSIALQAGYSLVAAVVSALMATLFYSLLVEFNRRL